MANEKHVFIGIGGQGCKTIAQIKEKVYEKRFSSATKSKTRLQAMNDSYRFIFLDTDQRDIDEANKRNRATFEDGKVPFISPQTDLVNLGRANPHAVYYEALQNPNTLINKRILEACSPELAAKIPDQPLSFGAGAFRIKSRIAFAHALADFQSKLQAAISSLNDVKTVGGEDCIIYYWLVSSSLGGTGSGIFNDVLYHINQLHHQIVGTGDPQLVYTMYMPKVFIDCNNTEEKYSLNAFGVFSELEAFKVMSFSEAQNTLMHRLAFNSDYNLVDAKKRYCPFYYLIPVDIQTDKGTSLGSPHTMIRNTAEMLYHLHNGQAGATFRSDIDNYMNDIMERDHKNFLVPMGYVSLQKPLEYFNKYMRFRLRKDILQDWLLCDTKEAQVDESEVTPLIEKLFGTILLPSGEIRKQVTSGPAKNDFEDALADQNPELKVLNSSMKWGEISGIVDSIVSGIRQWTNDKAKRDAFKTRLSEAMYQQAEGWIRAHGLTFAYNSVEAIHTALAEDYDQKIKKFSTTDVEELEKLAEECEAAEKEAGVDAFEKIGVKDNRKDIEAYKAKVQAYKDAKEQNAINIWAYDLLKDFCNDEKNDELAKLSKKIAAMKDKAQEMNRDAVKQFSKLASDMGNATMDVTTVYLPQITKICDGNGWIKDNLFSRLYATIFKLKDTNPKRKDFQAFIDEYIYGAVNEEILKEINKGEYSIRMKKIEVDQKTRKEKEIEYDDVRYFCNTKLDRTNDKIIDDFLTLATKVLNNVMSNSEEIQTKWDTKKISSFFADLSNDEKDDVRRSLSPALFFSYNANNIEAVKKEEHIVFVAGSEDLAEEMLGYQKGNNKHRFEKADSDDTALVLKSKYGLSLSDYRIYDNIKMVYDKATFREKYHFHHDFAQYGDKLTLDKLPVEILPQHYSYAKMLILDQFKEEMAPFFYVDEEFDSYKYEKSMILEKATLHLAMPEAFSINPADGKLVLVNEDNDRPLYKELEGNDFSDQFNMYCDIYHNYRFGETVESILQAILRQNRIVDGKPLKGEDILKNNYKEKRQALLTDLNKKKNEAQNPDDKRLYNVLFSIIRNDYETVHKFIK